MDLNKNFTSFDKLPSIATDRTIMKAKTKEVIKIKDILELAKKLIDNYDKGTPITNGIEYEIGQFGIMLESYHTSQSKPTPGDKYCEGWEDGRKAGIEEAQSKLPTNEEIEKQFPVSGEMPITETDRINTYKQEVAKWMRGKSNKQEIAKWLKTQSQLLTNAEIKEMAMEAQSKQPTEDEIMQELLNRFGFCKDGAIDCKAQLKIFDFVKWLRDQSQLQGEGEKACKHKRKELPYLQHIEWVDKLIAKGIKQKQCLICKTWLFPEEY